MSANVSGCCWVMSNGTYWSTSVTVGPGRNELAEKWIHERFSWFAQKRFMPRKWNRVQQKNYTFWFTEAAITFGSLGFCLKTFFPIIDINPCLQVLYSKLIFVRKSIYIWSSLYPCSTEFLNKILWKPLDFDMFLPLTDSADSLFLFFFVHSLQWSFYLLYLAKVTFSFLVWI